MLYNYFKSVVDMDIMPVVICNTEHIIIYMNPSAIKRYRKRGGGSLIGKSLLECHNTESRKKIEKVLAWFKKSDNNNRVFTFSKKDDENDYDVYMEALRDDYGKLIGYYEKHESRIHENQPYYNIVD